MTVKAILAVDSNGGIGYKNDLPWEHNAEDMRWFRDNTLHNAVVMGRKTWESLPKKLDKRYNVVITSKSVRGSDRNCSGSLSLIINDLKKSFSGVSIIGGANIFNQSWDLVDSVILTRFLDTYTCDTFIDLVALETAFPNTKIVHKNEKLQFEVRTK